MSGRIQDYDLTEGSILNKLLLVAIPIMGIQLMQMAYNLTDMYWLGKVGSDAVAASGSAGMYLWLSNGFLMIGRIGAEIGVSQSFGEKNDKAARAFSHNALVLSILIGTIYGLIMVLFSNPLIGFFNIREQSVASSAAAYLRITGLVIPLTFVTGTLTGTYNGSGNSKTPFYMNFLGLIINMVLDPLFIIVLNMGIGGAAIATAIGQSIVAITLLISIKYGKTRPFEDFKILIRPKIKWMEQIIRWSLPVCAESILFTMLSMITARIIAQWGADAMAAQRVGSQIESMAWLIGGGFSSAVAAFIGQNFGGGKWSRVRQGIRISTLTMFCWGIVVTLTLYFGGSFLISLFLHEEHIIAMGVTYLRFLALSQIVGCIEYNTAGAFRGIGKTVPPSIASIGGNIIRVPLIYALSRTSLGLNGVWLGITLGALIRSLWIIIWFYFTTRKLPVADTPIKILN